MHAQLMSPNTTYIGPYFTFAFTTVRTFIPDVRALFKRRLRSTGYLYWRCVSCNVSSDTSIRYSTAEGGRSVASTCPSQGFVFVE